MSFLSQAATLASFFVRKQSAPSGSENALVVRNIPSGVQAVSITSETPGTVISSYNSITSVASNATSTVLTYTVPLGNTNYLNYIDVSGSNIATYDILINGTEFSRKRTYFGGDLSARLDCGTSGFLLNSGDVVEVNVTNFRPDPGDFEARIQLLEP